MSTLRPRRPARRETAAQRLRLALELSDLAVEMKRLSLRRARPRASAAEIELALLAWLHERPGAEHGDGVGVPGRWPRRRGR